jgi:site-specific recombinase
MLKGPGAMTLHLKVVNDELARLGHTALLAKGQGHFYFRSGEAEGWFDNAVKVRKINSLTLKQWIAEFRRLKDLNERIVRTAKSK